MLPPLEDVYVVSADFRRAPIEFRELLAFGTTPVQSPEILLCQQPGIREAMWLETCDRVEAFLLADTEEAATTGLQNLWWHKIRMDASGCWDQFFVHRASGAFRHLCRTISGLDLAFPGSTYALEAVAQALARSTHSGTAGGTLSQIVDIALALGRRIHVEHQPPPGPCPATHAVISMLSRYFGPLHHRSALLLGSGLLAADLAQQLQREQVRLMLSGFAADQAEALGRILKVETIPLQALHSTLVDVDFVVAAASSSESSFQPLDIDRLMNGHGYRSLLALDLSFPRVLQAAPGSGIFLYDTDQVSRQWRERTELQMAEQESAVAAELAAVFRLPPHAPSAVPLHL